ncbi:acyl--CoA ligase [Pelagibacteraceae bacterium]|nr:acyl--CoA ligase [Pelagibacteraceae bacterium]
MKFFFKYFKKNKNKKLFVTDNKNSITYAKFYNRSLILASYIFFKKGSLKNKRILVNMSRSYNYFIVISALIKHGATIIPVSNKLSLLEISYIKKKYKPFAEINNSILNKTNFSFNKKINNDNFAKIIFFTSGTTGKPKGIQHKITKLFLSAIQFSKLSSYSKKDIVLHNWPHYYMAGFFNMFLCPIVSTSTIHFGEEIGVNTYLKYWKLLIKKKITKAYLSPTMAQALISYSSYNKLPKSKKINVNIFSTGAYLYDNIYKNFKNTFGINLNNCYGITEVGASIALSNENESNLVGNLSKGVFIKLSRKKEIMVKSKFFFEGYINSKGLLEKFNKKYFNTGDLGEKKGKAKYYIIGRNKEIIKKGGEQVSLLKIEDAALGFQNVEDVIAKGVRSEFWGEEIELDVVFKKQKKIKINKDGKQNRILLDQLTNYLSHKLSKIEMPKNITIVKSIPKTSIGKNYRQVF